MKNDDFTNKRITVRQQRINNLSRPKSQIVRLIERDGLRCHWCHRLCDPSLDPSCDLYPTREHVIRKSEGGSSKMHNLVVACRKCNNTRHPQDIKRILFTIISGA